MRGHRASRESDRGSRKLTTLTEHMVTLPGLTALGQWLPLPQAILFDRGYRAPKSPGACLSFWEITGKQARAHCRGILLHLRDVLNLARRRAAVDLQMAWIVNFNNGGVDSFLKTLSVCLSGVSGAGRLLGAAYIGRHRTASTLLGHPCGTRICRPGSSAFRSFTRSPNARRPTADARRLRRHAHGDDRRKRPLPV